MMRLVIILGLVSPVAQAAVVDGQAANQLHVRGSRPKYDYDPATKKSCTWWYDNEDGSTSCEDMPSAWAITAEQWKHWNPSVGASCQGFTTYRSYCVEATDDGQPTSPTEKPPMTTPDVPLTKTSDPPAATKPGNGIETPTPTQPGMVDNCNKFYKVVSGDNCIKIAQVSGIKLDEFLAWNPQVGGAACPGLWLDVHVCISVLGHTPSPKPKDGDVPSPVQPDISTDCGKYYKAVAGDTCQGIADKNQIALASFYKWNPAVNNDCSGLWAGYRYCVNVPGSFRARAFYHADCTGAMNNDVTLADRNDNRCIDTKCRAASLNIDAEGLCPGSQVQISYWEKPGCVGKWYGYGYTSRGTCRTLWTEGWKFRAVHLRCARRKDDCVSKGTCSYDPEPAKFVC